MPIVKVAGCRTDKCKARELNDRLVVTIPPVPRLVNCDDEVIEIYFN